MAGFLTSLQLAMTTDRDILIPCGVLRITLSVIFEGEKTEH